MIIYITGRMFCYLNGLPHTMHLLYLFQLHSSRNLGFLLNVIHRPTALLVITISHFKIHKRMKALVSISCELVIYKPDQDAPKSHSFSPVISYLSNSGQNIYRKKMTRLKLTLRIEGSGSGH